MLLKDMKKIMAALGARLEYDGYCRLCAQNY